MRGLLISFFWLFIIGCLSLCGNASDVIYERPLVKSYDRLRSFIAVYRVADGH
jgi:hypothetical protein